MSTSSPPPRASDPPAGPQSSDSGALQSSGARPISSAEPKDAPPRTIDVAPGADTGSQGTPSGPSSPAAETPTLKELVANLVVGTVIDGKYAIEAIIGRGGMGVVVSARHVDLGRDVALKFLCSADGATAPPDMRARFRREAQISAKLNNEHITRVLDVGTWKNASYIVMERLEGIDLRRKLKQGPLPIPVALNYTLQICEGIAEAHAHGIVHRDLKPANLFVTRKADGTDLVKIMDFGISKWTGGEIGEITKDGTLLGSPKYMAPEQVFGTKTIDARADIWSIGAILFEMLAGRTPFVETTLSRLCAALVAGPPPRLDEVDRAIPARLADVVARTLESSPTARIQTVAVLAGELLDAVDAPGEALRQRLAVILSMGPTQEPAPSTTNLLSNLNVGPVTAQTAPSHVLTAAAKSEEANAGPSGPPPAQTLVSPGSKAHPGTPAAEAQRPRTPYAIVAAVLAAGAAAFIAVKTTAPAKPPPSIPTAEVAPPVTMGETPKPPAQPVLIAPTPVATQAPVVAPAPVTPTATAVATAAPTASATAAVATPTQPVKGARPGGPAPHVSTPPGRPGTPTGKEKKGDDDIPTMR